MSQNAQILSHLKRGKTITGLDALEKFQCFRLASRVNELRCQGHKIATEMIDTAGGKKIARYRLVA